MSDGAPTREDPGSGPKGFEPRACRRADVAGEARLRDQVIQNRLTQSWLAAMTRD